MPLPVYGTLNINSLLLGLDLSIDKLHTTARHGFYLMVDIDSGFLTGRVLSPLSALIVGIYQRTKTQQLSASFYIATWRQFSRGALIIRAVPPKRKDITGSTDRYFSPLTRFFWQDGRDLFMIGKISSFAT